MIAAQLAVLENSLSTWTAEAKRLALKLEQLPLNERESAEKAHAWALQRMGEIRREIQQRQSHADFKAEFWNPRTRW